MINAFIITEEGRAYSEEGQKYVRENAVDAVEYCANKLGEKIEDDETVMICMGNDYNNREFLANELEKNKKTVIAVSTKYTICFIVPTDIPAAIKNLRNPEIEAKTSYELFMMSDEIIQMDEDARKKLETK